MLSRTLKWAVTVALVSVVALVLTPTLYASRDAGASTSLSCSALTVTTRHSGYSTETVKVQTSPGARIVATAHYQRLTRVSKSSANSGGAAILSFHDSDPQGHFHVNVDVSVTLGTARATCATGFGDD